MPGGDPIETTTRPRVVPFLRRSVIEPLWAREVGTPILRAWRELEVSQRMPESVLRDRQWERLRGLVDFVFHHNPYYRTRFLEHGLSSESLRSPEDLRLFPLMTKKDIRGRQTEMLSEGCDPQHLMTIKTGGSTGVSLTLHATEAVSESRNACARRFRRWTGWEVGEPVAAVWGNPSLPESLRDRLRDFLLRPTIFLDTMCITQESVIKFAEAWKRSRPTLLFGHAHSLFILAGMTRDLGIGWIDPKGIVGTSMMLLPHERRSIEQVFGVPVFDHYGCEEVGPISAECERHEGMHINTDQLVVEFLREDGSPARPGEPGLVVVTDLLNREMPLIRYRMEDMAEPIDGCCSCGRGLPLMKNVSGRVADFLVRGDGSRVAGVSLIENTLTRIAGIEQMQIVQEALYRFEVRIVPDARFGTESARELKSYFCETFPGAEIEVHQVERIQQEANGKYRFSICRVHS